MKYRISILLSAAIFLIAILCMIFPQYEFFIFSLSAILILMILNNLGKGIVLRESIALLYALTCLLIPWAGYEFYNADNSLAKLWVRSMPVPDTIYFDYALPAISLFCFAITLPLSTREEDRGEALQELIQRMKSSLEKKQWIGVKILGVGLVVSFLVSFLPKELQFFGLLFFFASFAGLLYIYYAPSFPYKIPAIAVFLIFIIANSISTGMFTIVAYMGITIFSFFYLGRKSSLLKKVIFLAAGVGFFLVLQNAKVAYRKYTWGVEYEGSKAKLFGELFLDNIVKGDALIEKDAFFPVYLRTNHGFNVGLVMRRIPAQVPYDQGKKLFVGFVSSLVPRFLWPDKPEAGGRENMLYYAGWRIRKWSTNVGPLGEAYGSFGRNGGIIYMFFMGLFIRFAYRSLFKLARKNPILICWIPVLFFQTTYSAETDTLQIFNSLIKTAFFIWLLYKFLPNIFPGSNYERNTYIPKKKSTILQY